VRQKYAAAIALPYDEYARATMPFEFAPGWTDRNAERYEDILRTRFERPAGHKTLDAHLRVCWQHYTRGCAVEDIDVPALVIHGGADLVVPVENGRMLAARLQNAEYVELDGAGHNLQLEVPGTFNELVLQFLARA
jgi:pimeloyl-ACP methyl ester carboxylesterase